jgi:hypothetical protein
LSNCKITDTTEKELAEQSTKEFELTFNTPEKTEKITLSG